MTTKKFISKQKNEIDWDKTKRDLDFIKSFQLLCISNNWRIVVFGGYGLDILLGQMTRTHNDVDLLIYGQSTRSTAREIIAKYLSTTSDLTIKVSENDFMLDIDPRGPGFGANIYYVQTALDPQIDLHQVVKKNGEQVTNSEKQFPSPVIGKLNDFQIEVQNPNSHLADILFKQRSLEHRSNHDQDIANLRAITESSFVKEIMNLS